MLQQKHGDVLAAIHAGPQECILQLLFHCRRLQTAVRVKESPYEIDASNAGRALEIEWRSSRGKKLCRSWPPVGKAGNHQGLRIAGQIWFVDYGAVVQQYLQQRLLHSSHLG